MIKKYKRQNQSLQKLSCLWYHFNCLTIPLSTHSNVKTSILIPYLILNLLSSCSTKQQLAPIEYRLNNSKENKKVIIQELKTNDPSKGIIIKFEEENYIISSDNKVTKVSENSIKERSESFNHKSLLYQKKQEEQKKAIRKPSLPVEGNIITKFGQKTKYGTSKGINISAKEGTRVISITSGRVVYADYDPIFGNLVIIKLDNKNIAISYAHLKDLIVVRGASVKHGEVIGHVGKTGKVQEPQLYFSIRQEKKAIDPLGFKV